jgi:hypothetical protein
MRITGTEITVMGEVRGIGPWSGGSEAAALTGEDQTVATGQGQIMNEAGRLPVTAAMRGAESGNVRDTGTGTTEDHHLWKGPTKKSIRDLEGVMVYRLFLNLLDAHQSYLGRLLKIQILGLHPRRL